ncbi:MAG: GNAT family N-acetyltransferase [Caldilineaceae bacterium]
MSQPVFVTDRLLARRLGAEDLEALFATYSDAEAMRWVGDGQPISRPECEQWVAVTLANYEKRGYGMFALEEHASGNVIGFCGIVHPGGQVEPEIKYTFLRSHWGRGLATEAVIGLLRYGIEVHGLTFLIATVAPDNGASQRVLLKAGMTRGELRTNEDGAQTQLFFWRKSADIA